MDKQESVSYPSVIIIGGGIIGVTCAYYLAKEGVLVTLLEKDKINAGSTYGNAGLILPNDSLPVPAPGVLTQGIRWLLDSQSPFYIKPTLDLALLRWLWRFQKACSPKAWKKAVPVLTDLSEKSIPLFEELIAEEDISCEYHKNGFLLLFHQENTFQKAQKKTKALNEFGISGEILSQEDLQTRFPPALPTLTGGIFYESDAHLDPAALTAQIAQRAQSHGAQILTNREVLDFSLEKGRIREVHTTTGTYLADQIILAAGAWSPRLGDHLDLRLPVQPAKGYSITVQRPDEYPELPLILDEAKIAVTPLGDSLRFAGTLELAGLDMKINPKRVEAIRRGAEDYLDLEIETYPLVELWRGLRPCTPDGLPIIGRSQRIQNLIVATGHCMLGVSQGTMTAKLVAEILLDQEPSLDLDPLRVDRF
jgi:D-amino-acid dehydrogenase